jgi:hypothetical protein
MLLGNFQASLKQSQLYLLVEWIKISIRTGNLIFARGVRAQGRFSRHPKLNKSPSLNSGERPTLKKARAKSRRFSSWGL